MFSIVRLVIRIAVLMLALMLVLAYFTNPDMNAFKAEAKSQLNGKVSDQSNDPSLGYIAEMGVEFTDQIVENLVERKNFYLCSVYTVSLPDGRYRYLGAYHTFYPLQDKDPLEYINRFNIH